MAVQVGGTDSFVGRGRELAVVERALGLLASRTSGWVALAGEPGIGKTRLVAEVGARAQSRGYLVRTGRGTELERAVPFGIAVDALDDYLSGLDPRRLAQLGADRLGELAAVFPSLASLEARTPSALQAERYRAHRAVRALLERLAGSRPLVLALDDLHWADAASVELVGHLLRRPLDAPVLLVLAFRPRQLPEPLQTALAHAAREESGTYVELGPLSADDAGELLADVPSEAVRDQLYRDSGGNPFYLEQLVRSGARSTVTPTSAVDELPGVPPSVSTTIAVEIAGLSVPARRFAQAAAVAGQPFDIDLAAAAADVVETQALRSVDELVAADLARPTDLPRRFGFRHPIVRRAVYSSASPGWRLGAHERVAAAMAAQGAAETAYAHHIERSAKPGDQQAIAVLTAAGNAAAPRAPAIAARWFAAALRLMPDECPACSEEAQHRMRLLVALALSLGAAGQLEESHAALEQAVASLPAEQAARRVRLVAFCAAMEHLLGRHQHAHNRLMHELEQLADHHSREAAALKIELSTDGVYAGDYGQMLKWAQDARETAQSVGDPLLCTVATALLAWAGSFLGPASQALEHLTEAAELFDGLDDAQLARRLDAASDLGWAEGFLERFDDAIHHMQRGIAVSRATGQGQVLVPLMLGQAFALSYRGRLSEAAELAEAAVESSRLSSHTQLLGWALSLRCLAATMAGDVPTALAAGEESFDIARRVDQSALSSGGGWIFALALLVGGAPERARTELLAAAGGPGLRLLGPGHRSIGYEILTVAELALARVEAAHEWARRAEIAVAGITLPLACSAAKRACAAVLLAKDQPTLAVPHARAAAELAAAAGARIEAARSRILLGQALARAGQAAAAIQELETAEAELAACGARRFRDEAARELRLLGRNVARGGRRRGQGSGSLSPREREVAHLVATGKTNRQIAGELFLSEKTVEAHLAKVFAKLGVSARAAVAGAVARGEA